MCDHSKCTGLIRSKLLVTEGPLHIAGLLPMRVCYSAQHHAWALALPNRDGGLLWCGLGACEACGTGGTHGPCEACGLCGACLVCEISRFFGHCNHVTGPQNFTIVSACFRPPSCHAYRWNMAVGTMCPLQECPPSVSWPSQLPKALPSRLHSALLLHHPTLNPYLNCPLNMSKTCLVPGKGTSMKATLCFNRIHSTYVLHALLSSQRVTVVWCNAPPPPLGDTVVLGRDYSTGLRNNQRRNPLGHCFRSVLMGQGDLLCSHTSGFVPQDLCVCCALFIQAAEVNSIPFIFVLCEPLHRLHCTLPRGVHCDRMLHVGDGGATDRDTLGLPQMVMPRQKSGHCLQRLEQRHGQAFF